jgi:hypothetical protein
MTPIRYFPSMAVNDIRSTLRGHGGKGLAMPEISISERKLVYVRGYSTRRSAVGALVGAFSQGGTDWGRVRLITDWYDWDGVPPQAGPLPHAGELLDLEAFRLEAIRE